jgi:hypothetical protein
MVFLSATSLAAQYAWLPQAVQQGMAEQLADRLTTIGPGRPKDPAGLLGGSRKQVLEIAGRLDSWGKAVVERAPRFPKLTLPPTRDRHLDAMGRYQLCNLVLLRQFETTSHTVETRRVGAVGLTAVTMAIVYLREPFVAGGGPPEGIEAFLTSPAMGRLTSQLQTQPDLMSHVEEQCGTVVAALFGG